MLFVVIFRESLKTLVEVEDRYFVGTLMLLM